MDYTWGQAMEQARRMAAHLKAQNFEPGFRIAILSKNCAHFVMAELAIWLAGGTTVAIFPTETADTVRYVLEHSGASLLFVGKLDTWEQQKPGVPAGLPCIAFPLAPKNDFDTWDKVIARTKPLTGHIQRAPTDICILMYTSGSTGQPKGVMHSFERATAALKASLAASRTTQAETLTSGAVLPAAGAHLRARLGGMRRSSTAAATSTLPKHWKPSGRPEPRATQCVHLGATSVAEVPAWRVLKMPPKSSTACWHSDFGTSSYKEIEGLGLDQVLMAGSGSPPIRRTGGLVRKPA